MSGIRQDLEEIKKTVEQTDKKVQEIKEYLARIMEVTPE